MVAFNRRIYAGLFVFSLIVQVDLLLFILNHSVKFSDQKLRDYLLLLL